MRLVRWPRRRVLGRAAANTCKRGAATARAGRRPPRRRVRNAHEVHPKRRPRRPRQQVTRGQRQWLFVKRDRREKGRKDGNSPRLLAGGTEPRSAYIAFIGIAPSARRTKAALRGARDFPRPMRSGRCRQEGSPPSRVFESGAQLWRARNGGSPLPIPIASEWQSGHVFCTCVYGEAEKNTGGKPRPPGKIRAAA